MSPLSIRRPPSRAGSRSLSRPPAARRISAAIDETLPFSCELDLGGVDFMDSSGIAVVLGVFRRMRALGGETSVVRTPACARKILDAAGVPRIVSVK